MKRLLCALFVLLIPTGTLFAGEDDDAAAAEKARQKALERQAKVSIEIFRKNIKTRDLGRKMNALLELSTVEHDLVIDEFGQRAMKDRNPEFRDAAANLMGDMGFHAELAGNYLRDFLMKNEDFPEVQVSIIRSIGKLKYLGALEELKESAEHLNEEKYQWVTVEVVRTFGVLEDKRCLPFLLWMSEYGGKVLKWATGSVSVDTGASGDADQRAAEQAWQKKYGHVKPKKPPAPLIRTYMQELQTTVKKLTGQEFKNATEFREWLIEHAKELGLDPRKLTK